MQETVSVVVDKEAYEVAQAMVQVARDIKKALADGWDVSTDLPAIVGSAVANFATKVQDFQALPEMAKENLPEFIKAWLLSGADMVDALRK